MKPPDRDQTGCTSVAKSLVIQPSSFVSRLKTRPSTFVRPAWLWKAIFVPSGDHLGERCSTASLESVVICCGFWPRASTTQIRRGPAQDVSTAIREPSGEYAGSKASRSSQDSFL